MSGDDECGIPALLDHAMLAEAQEILLIAWTNGRYKAAVHLGD